MAMTDPTRRPESYEARAFIEWRDLAVAQLRVDGRAAMAEKLGLLFHIVNEGKRGWKAQADFKLMGGKAGVSDYFLPVKAHSFAGLWIEMKQRSKKCKETDNQKAWLDAMIAQGYMAATTHGSDEAIDLVRWYLGLGDYGL